MGRLCLAPCVLDLSICSNGRRRDIKRAAVILGEAKDNSDVVLLGGLANELHLRRVEFERVVDIFADAFEVNSFFPRRKSVLDRLNMQLI